jgi:hypothetical protein
MVLLLEASMGNYLWTSLETVFTYEAYTSLNGDLDLMGDLVMVCKTAWDLTGEILSMITDCLICGDTWRT